MSTNLEPFEFSDSTGFNSIGAKENYNAHKLASACIESIEYITATTETNIPLLEFVVRFHDDCIVEAYSLGYTSFSIYYRFESIL